MAKRHITLNESALYGIIERSIKKVLSEGNFDRTNAMNRWAMNSDTLEDYDNERKYKDASLKLSGDLAQMRHPQATPSNALYCDDEPEHNKSLASATYARHGYIDDNIVSEAVTKSIRKVLSEGIYDYPDGIDHIILLSENDRELYEWYDQMYKMLLKKALKGTELSVDTLANSSMMKKYQQACFRKYKSEQAAEGMMIPDAPYQFRKYVSEKLITDVHYDAESRMGNRDKEDMFGAENV